MSTENVQTIDQFIAKHGIKFECRRVDSRPDGLGDWDKTARHFQFRGIRPGWIFEREDWTPAGDPRCPHRRMYHLRLGS